jgi:hypothetical protein
MNNEKIKDALIINTVINKFVDKLSANKIKKVTDTIVANADRKVQLAESEIKKLVTKGDKGDKGDQGIPGKNGTNGIDGLNGRNGIDGKDGVDGKDGSVITPKQIVDKLESLKGDKRLSATSIKGLKEFINSQRFPVTLINSPSGGSTGGSSVSDGDVVGPASSTDHAIPRFNLTTGKIIQNSGVTIDDNDSVTIPSIVGRGLTVDNDGTDTGIQVLQDGVLASSRFAVEIQGNSDNTNPSQLLRIYSNFAHTSSSVNRELFRVENDNASSVMATLVNLKQDGNGVVLAVNQNLTTSSTNAVAINDLGTGANGTALFVSSARTTRNVLFRNTAGTGTVLELDQNGSGRAFYMDKDTTNSNMGTVGVQIDGTSVVDDGATYTKTGALVQINSTVTETSGVITDSAQVLDINQTHADATGNVVDIANGGVGTALKVESTGTAGSNSRVIDVRVTNDLSASGAHGVLIYSNTAHTTATIGAAALLRVENDNASAVNGAMFIKQDGSGNAFYVQNTNSGGAVRIAQDAVNATNNYAFFVDSNAIQANAELVRFRMDNASSTTDVLWLDNDGTGSALKVDQDGTLANNKVAFNFNWNTDNANTSNAGMRVYSNFAHTSATEGRSVINVTNDNASSLANLVHFQQDGSGTGVFLDNNGNGIALNIDHDGNSGSVITGLNIDVANAGVGGGQAINIVAGVLMTADDIEISTIGKGVIVKSPNGTRWRLTVDDAGASVWTSL